MTDNCDSSLSKASVVKISFVIEYNETTNMKKILSAQKLFENSDDECPVLGYRLLQGGCLKPYLGDVLAINENIDVVVKVN